MRTRSRCAVLLAVPLLLAGCGGSAPAGDAAAAPTSSPGVPAATSTPSSPSTGHSGDDAPSETAAMICGDDVVGDVTAALSLPAPPATTATWANRVYTCTYSLPVGPLVLAVKESPNPAAAADFLRGQLQHVGDNAPVAGLGERAYATPTGTVVVLKDSMTLVVDATRLPEVFGDNGQQRNAFAFEVASIVLGCWTGNE